MRCRKTLAAFLEETNLEHHNFEPKDPKTALTLEKVLDEKRLYDLSLKVEKINVAEDDPDFTEPCMASGSYHSMHPTLTVSQILRFRQR